MIDNKLVAKVMNRLSAEITVEDTRIQEGEEKIRVLNDMVQMAKQLEEKVVLDKAIDKRRAELTTIEDEVEKVYKAQQEQVASFGVEITNEKKRLVDTKAEVNSKITENLVYCNEQIADRQKFVKNTIKELEDETKGFITLRDKARDECGNAEADLNRIKVKVANV